MIHFRRGAHAYQLPVAAILDLSKWPPLNISKSTLFYIFGSIRDILILLVSKIMFLRSGNPIMVSK